MCCKNLKRRDFLKLTAGALAGAGIARRTTGGGGAGSADWPLDRWNPDRPLGKHGQKLRVQPVLLYAVSRRREKASWKSWGGVQSEETARKESQRIKRELDSISRKAGFPLEILPLRRVKSRDEAARARESDRDVTLLYPATGSGNLLRACVPASGQAVIFVRHRSGPVYYWYEALSTRYLVSDRKPATGGDAPFLPNVSVHDVAVDELDELLWRFRAIYAVKNFLGTRIVALGGPWGKYSPEAPRIAAEKFGFEIIPVEYASIEPRLGRMLRDKKLLSRAEAWTSRYLSIPGTELQTDRKFVVNAFLLHGLFRDLLEEHNASAFTIKNCMRTIMPMSETTACLTLSLLNDEGLLAFCESDFVVIPAGVLLRHISGKPVFLHNSTFPHGGIVTCAHCTGPRRMDGNRYEPVKVLTHFESEFGAAPKVEIPLGQEVTFIDPEYSTGRWIGFRGNVTENPLYEICRSQQDVAIQGDWKRLLHEVRDSHWMMSYGNHLEEAGYAARKIGIRWENFSEA